MLENIFAFIFVLGVLIFIHELGHFLVAKKVGIKVEKFSLGFPPNIFAKKWGETEYCIGMIPLGGFVKMAGENPDEEVKGSPDEFMSKSVGQRAAVIFAGPFMNYLLAIVIMVIVWVFTGIPKFDESKLVIGEIQPGYPAAEVGMDDGDVILSIDNTPVTTLTDAQELIFVRGDQPTNVTFVHNGDTLSKEVVPIPTPSRAEDGSIDTVGMLGFRPKIIGYESIGLWNSIKTGVVEAHLYVAMTVSFVKQLVMGETSAKNLGGPVFIAQQSGRFARSGPVQLFKFMALLSVNLAVLNVLPVPVLDGGHLVFLAIEKIRGAPLSMRARMIAQQIGVVLILGLVVMVTYNDIMRIIRGL